MRRTIGYAPTHRVQRSIPLSTSAPVLAASSNRSGARQSGQQRVSRRSRFMSEVKAVFATPELEDRQGEQTVFILSSPTLRCKESPHGSRIEEIGVGVPQYLFHEPAPGPGEPPVQRNRKTLLACEI